MLLTAGITKAAPMAAKAATGGGFLKGLLPFLGGAAGGLLGGMGQGNDQTQNMYQMGQAYPGVAPLLPGFGSNVNFNQGGFLRPLLPQTGVVHDRGQKISPAEWMDPNRFAPRML